MSKRNIKVEITETLQRVVESNASSRQEALDMITDKYKNQEIVLDWGDFTDKEIKVIKAK